MSTTAERHTFQAEAQQVLDLMIHSIYTHKDIFLRELISNASDALDKRRFEALSNPALLENEGELHIRLAPDTDARLLTIADNGIGMTRDEVRDLIGTIAKSGTKEFAKRLKEQKDKTINAELIGQFGVGFYSAFMVADKVTLVTRKAGEESATRWESAGDGTYTIEEAERETPGTTITLHLKEADGEDGMEDFTQEWTLRQTVKKYSDFVAYPIRMEVRRTETPRDEEGKPVEGAESEEVVEDATLNSMKAIWLRPRDEVTDEEHNEFYRHIAHDWTDPLYRIQAKIEGTLEYQMLLYIPSKRPMNLSWRDSHQGIHLYVKRVFIMDDCKELLPEWLRFVRGVIDSEDLSLNVSRETLQHDRQIQRIRKGVVKKVLDEIGKMAKNEPEKFDTLWQEFGAVLKEGIFQEPEYQEAILNLCRFRSSADATTMTSLEGYIERMQDGQEAIYYLTGESLAVVEHSPHLEAFRDKGIEVLYLTDPVDEVWTTSFVQFREKDFKSIGKGAVDLGSEDEKKAREEARKEHEEKLGGLLGRLKTPLDARVKSVRLSDRLTASVACLVTDEGDLSPQMEAMMKAMGQEVPPVKRILELNPTHPVVARLQAIAEANGDDPALAEYAELLYGQALLAEGGQLPEPAAFAKRVAELMQRAL